MIDRLADGLGSGLSSLSRTLPRYLRSEGCLHMLSRWWWPYYPRRTSQTRNFPASCSLPLPSSQPFCLHPLSLRCALLTQTQNLESGSCFHTNSLSTRATCSPHVLRWCHPVLIICASLGVFAPTPALPLPKKRVPSVQSICIGQAGSLEDLTGDTFWTPPPVCLSSLSLIWPHKSKIFADPSLSILNLLFVDWAWRNALKMFSVIL